MQVLPSITVFTCCLNAAHCQLRKDVIHCNGFVCAYVCWYIFNRMFLCVFWKSLVRALEHTTQGRKHQQKNINKTQYTEPSHLT